MLTAADVWHCIMYLDASVCVCVNAGFVADTLLDKGKFCALTSKFGLNTNRQVHSTMDCAKQILCAAYPVNEMACNTNYLTCILHLDMQLAPSHQDAKPVDAMH